jgi:hypothetical protein
MSGCFGIIRRDDRHRAHTAILVRFGGYQAATRGGAILRPLVFALTLTIVLRLIFFVASSADPGSRQLTDDSPGYLLLGKNLAEGRGFGRASPGTPWLPEILRTPGYPVLLALLERATGNAQTAVLVVQHLLGVALVGILTVVSGRTFGPRAAWGAGILAALDLQGIVLSNLVLTESIYGFMLLLCVLLAARVLATPSIGWAVLCGIVAGSSALVRPTSIALPTMLGLLIMGRGLFKGEGALLRRRETLIAGLVVAIIGEVIIGGWIVRNGRTTGEYVLSTVARGQLLYCHASETLAWARGQKGREEAYQELCARLGLQSEQVKMHALSPEKNAEIRQLTLETIRAHPSAFAVNTVLKTANTIFAPEKRVTRIFGLPALSFGFLNPRGRTAPPSPLVAGIILFQVVHLAVLFGLALRTLWNAVRRRIAPPLVWLGLAVTLYIFVLSIGPPGDPRYRWPVIPLLILIAAAGLAVPKQP